MEQRYRIAVQIDAEQAASGSLVQDLLAALEQHRRTVLEQQDGFQEMRVVESADSAGNVHLTIETRWRDADSLDAYQRRDETLATIVERHEGARVVAGPEVEPAIAEEPAEPAVEAQRRLLLPLLIPAIAFFFAALIIYVLSRVYLDLRSLEVGEVNMATPVAIVIALAILGVSWYLATHPRIPAWQTGAIVAVGVALLIGGGIFSAVYEPEHEAAAEEPAAEATPPPGGEVAPGALQVSLVEFSVVPSEESTSAGEVTLAVVNEGAIPHNLRVIRTDLPPDDLPLADGTVDEDAVDVVAATDDLLTGESEDLTVDLEPGSYVLICNVPGHYQSGMRVAFTVQ